MWFVGPIPLFNALRESYLPLSQPLCILNLCSLQLSTLDGKTEKWAFVAESTSLGKLGAHFYIPS